ncbi:N-6 DNA methylase [Luteimonas sp. JM171]|uniref:type I restriction-modification system subunit M n=1 Tax=Luteimonas sp. JM171 TaxID=1896164 RepID=UPI000858F0D2|nr:class I SAM-dependent DNA methyltransferase [Luteimonas sp. JM171]AOH35463.1 N-6 DNA methylase [Luteimonas sp. JM171]
MTNEEFKRTLWEAADKLRGSVAAATYKYPVLGLVFLKYVSDMFDAQGKRIRKRLADPRAEYYIEDEESRAELAEQFAADKTFYDADNVFWVPPNAHFNALLAQAAAPDLAQRLDKALGEIEAENPSLKGVLYREFSRLELEPGKLGELMQLLARLSFDPDRHGSRDVFGEVYEYFLGQFALKEGARAGEFYTPKSVVNLLVEILAPFKGTIYDPACGSGGMFVQSAKFKDAHAAKLKKKGDLAIYGQEMMAATRRLALMNLAVHGLHGDLGATYGDTFSNDQHKTLRADYVLANPPFNISDWGGDKLADDPRWVYGIPPKGNANFAWLQHMLARLSSRGRAGIVLANGSMSSQQSGEGEIRRGMVQDDVVECMVALPGQLFSNTQIPACLWFLSRDKKPGQNGSVDRSGQILFIDARRAASGRISRTQIEFTDEDLQRVAQAYHRWRGTEFSDGEEYEGEPGFCFSATLEDVEKHGYVLTPGRYVGAVAEEEDDEAFAEKMERLTAELAEQMAKGAELDAVIRERLGALGYGV